MPLRVSFVGSDVPTCNVILFLVHWNSTGQMCFQEPPMTCGSQPESTTGQPSGHQATVACRTQTLGQRQSGNGKWRKYTDCCGTQQDLLRQEVGQSVGRSVRQSVNQSINIRVIKVVRRNLKHLKH